jgi:hypothetical protein
MPKVYPLQKSMVMTAPKQFTRQANIIIKVNSFSLQKALKKNEPEISVP